MQIKPFDASGVKPAVANEILPVDWYSVTITASEIKQTSKKTGELLALEFTIVDGIYTGRKCYTNLNRVNSNAKAVEIGDAELSAICHATGVMLLNDSAQLHNIPFQLKLGMAKPEPDYPEPRNEVKGYRKLGGATAATNVPLTNAAPPPIAAPAPAAAADWVNVDVATPAVAVPAVTAPVVVPLAVAAPPAIPEVIAQVPVKSPLEHAVADGWIKHPTSPGWHYKGQDVKADADVTAMYTTAAITAPASAPSADVPPWERPAG